jgi:hypothetical protein
MRIGHRYSASTRVTAASSSSILRLQLRARRHEVLEVARRPDEILARAFNDVVLELLGFQRKVQLLRSCPFLVILELAARLLREQVIRDADRQLAL